MSENEAELVATALDRSADLVTREEAANRLIAIHPVAAKLTLLTVAADSREGSEALSRFGQALARYESKHGPLSEFDLRDTSEVAYHYYCQTT